MPDPQNTALALTMQDVSKRFGATQALDSASFQIGGGEIHALLGENGAGKSTLVKILSGLTRPDSGTISVFGTPTELPGARAAHALGLRTAFQEISLVPDLTVAENLLLPEAPIHLGFVLDRRRAAEWVDGVLTRLELHDLDPRVDVRDCALPIRQKLEIASHRA
jgi:ribose transport system ATP-binding protein